MIILSTIDGFITFQWKDGESYCLAIDQFKAFCKKHKIDIKDETPN